MDLNPIRIAFTGALLAAGALTALLATAIADERKPAAPPQAGSRATSPEPAATAKPGVAAQPVKPLDLRAPDVTKLLTPQQLHQLLARTLRDNIENVEVEGTRARAPTNTPRVWGGIAAPFWALLNPTQAWRILAPLPPDQAREIGNDAPDATRRLIEPAAPVNP